MSLLSAPLREWNYNKIKRLTKSGCSDGTIASAINDDLNARQIANSTPLTAADITAYKKISQLAGDYSLISEPKIRALCDVPDPDMSLT